MRLAFVLANFIGTASAAYWASAGAGECAGNDVAFRDGILIPEADWCTDGGSARVAICWDGTTYTNTWDNRPYPWCVYKGAGVAENCDDGTGNTGYRYYCRNGVNPDVPSMSPSVEPTAKAPWTKKPANSKKPTKSKKPSRSPSMEPSRKSKKPSKNNPTN